MLRFSPKYFIFYFTYVFKMKLTSELNNGGIFLNFETMVIAMKTNLMM